MRAVLSVTLIVLGLQAAQAGPLLDRLRERRAERAEWGEEADGASAGKLPAGSRVLRDLVYGPDARQRLDVYLPAAPKQAPVILMVHGGAWRTGDKAMSRVVDNKAARWLARGVIFISTNYRLLPTPPHEQAQDVARALAFAQGKAAGWGGDPAAFALMGHSAGAHLVSLLNSAPQIALGQGARPWLGTISLDTAAMDIVATMEGKHYGFYDKAFGSDPMVWQASSPYQQLTREAPPLLAVCSSQRPDQPCAGTRRYAQQARSLGLRVELREQAASHGEINEQLGLPGAYTDAVEAFLASLAPAWRAALAP
ncbi:alpha/beta hydrolase [Uliginosibacterium sp. 31-12]|uniref:alpha/beta hydrolase n=1 Tax=Uliginosibacterium sp. 31-12 TaxID=3062781 RepID=UPI0026E395BF|nr:alpha/beta hydrolase [Uliginosibacterium sp. 31-12]MDO6386748.1 alpha/beta hydrolase [Uliginosibacterium sp. 31-12]